MGGYLIKWAGLARTVLFHTLHVSDRDRWRNFTFPEEWKLRLQRIAEFIPPKAHVFEFGCGPVGLRPYLHPSCSLVSADFIERGPEVMMIDLNSRPLPALDSSRTQIAVFSGVLEYVSDLPSLLEWVARHFDLCIASYECASLTPGILGRTREVIGRSHQGWVNHYTEPELKALFESTGFQLKDRTSWGIDDPGEIFVFWLPSAEA